MDRIGFIGAGNMAEALIKGLIAAGVCRADGIVISDVRAERLEALADAYGVRAAADNTALVREAEVVVLSVKPQQIDAVLDELGAAGAAGKIVISIAAGVRTAKISSRLGDVPIIRVMPNTPALVGMGMSGLFSPNADAAAMQKAERIFSAVGKTVVVEREELIDAVTAVSGSGPAYFFLLMEEMIRTAGKLGLDEADAQTLVLQTARGAAELAAAQGEKGQGPEELRRKVTSPGGTTEAAIKLLLGRDFADMIESALTAARDRSVELSRCK